MRTISLSWVEMPLDRTTIMGNLDLDKIDRGIV
jgi:hypothetical protein